MKKINLSGIIGEDITLQKLQSMLSPDSSEKLAIYLDSVGGYLTEARSLYNYIKSLPREVTFVINPTAASAAAYLAMSGKYIHVYKNSAMMIHRSHNLFAGNSEELRQNASVLSGMDEIMADAFSVRTKKSKDELLSLMNTDYWIIGGDALKSFGFADVILDEVYEEEDIYTAAKNALVTFGKGYAVSHDLDNLAAMLNIENKGVKPEENINKEKVHIDMSSLKEILASNSPATAEFDALLASAEAVSAAKAVEAERGRIAKILKSGGYNSVSAKAIESGVSFEVFAELEFSRMRKEAEKAELEQTFFIPTAKDKLADVSAISDGKVFDEEKLRAGVKAFVSGGAR